MSSYAGLAIDVFIAIYIGKLSLPFSLYYLFHIKTHVSIATKRKLWDKNSFSVTVKIDFIIVHENIYCTWNLIG